MQPLQRIKYNNIILALIRQKKGGTHMKLQIQSTQSYGTHNEEIYEEFDCKIENLDKMTCILYSKGRFVLKENSVIIENGNNKLLIKKGYRTNLTYKTEHGNIEMIVKGISVDIEWEDGVRNDIAEDVVGNDVHIVPHDNFASKSEKNPPSLFLIPKSVRVIYEITLGNNLPYINDVRLTIIR
jgi:hypothetical protein